MGRPVDRSDHSFLDLDYVGVKAPQFSFTRLTGADPTLGVEMASTGEVACLGWDFDEAYLKALVSVGFRFPIKSVLLSTGPVKSKATLLEMFELAAQADLLVAYAPQASMGTAIEMWQAFRARVPIVTVSPLGANWVVKHLSDVVLPDLSTFRSWVADGGLPRLLSRRVS